MPNLISRGEVWKAAWSPNPHSMKVRVFMHTRLINKAPISIALLDFRLAAVLIAGLATALAGVKPGDPFPELASFHLEGKLPDVSTNRIVLVDFWASWCGPCKESFPVMEELQQRYGTQGLVIIAVNVDENRADMEDFLKHNRVTFTIVRDTKQKLVDKTGIATMPSSFLLDREGKVRFTHNGFRGEETKRKYAEEIESLLKK